MKKTSVRAFGFLVSSFSLRQSSVSSFGEVFHPRPQVSPTLARFSTTITSLLESIGGRNSLLLDDTTFESVLKELRLAMIL